MIGISQRLREVYWVRQVRRQRTPSARPPCLIPLALRGRIHRYIIESAWLRIAEDIVDDVCRHSCVIGSWRNRSSWGFEGGVVKTDLTSTLPGPVVSHPNHYIFTIIYL